MKLIRSARSALSTLKTPLKALLTTDQQAEVRTAINKIKSRVSTAVLSGSEFECPSCGVTLRKFLPGGSSSGAYDEYDIVGGGWRENMRCPRCGATDRERHLLIYLRGAGRDFWRQKDVLHVAPEPSIYEELGCGNTSTYLSVDIEPDMANIAMDVTSLAFPENSFDLVLCNHVLEHVENDFRAMREIRRVLRPDGTAILQVPIARNLETTIEGSKKMHPEEQEEKFGEQGHVRIYGRDYLERLRNAGLSVIVTDAAATEGEVTAAAAAVPEHEQLFICTISGERGA